MSAVTHVVAPLDPVPFRFSAPTHEYVSLDTGEVFPHITGLLVQSGWVNDEWYTEESCERGQRVHRLCAEFDLGAIGPADLGSVDERYAGWIRAHAKAMQVLRPEILAVEEPAVHPVYRFGGRPDRLVKLYGLISILELKSGVPHKAHPIQTALQAILLAPTVGLPEDGIARFTLYLRKNGKFTLERHPRRADLDEAHRLIRAHCR
jgi:hypothetical protein